MKKLIVIGEDAFTYTELENIAGEYEIKMARINNEAEYHEALAENGSHMFELQGLNGKKDSKIPIMETVTTEYCI